MTRSRFGHVTLGTSITTLVVAGLVGACSGKTTPDPVATPQSGKTPAAPGNPAAPTGPMGTGTGSGTGSGTAMPVTIDPDQCVNATTNKYTAEPHSCCEARLKYGGREGADNTCGPNGNENCCAFDTIPGGTFNRMNNMNLPATVSKFNLGRYLVTTARFKVWMEEGGGLQANAPPYDRSPNPLGQHPDLGAATGWQSAWNVGGSVCNGAGCLAADTDALNAKVYADQASLNAGGWGCTLDQYPNSPKLPVDCVDYYEATAFCAWDGGYLITEAQYEYAIHGGNMQLKYSWGDHPPTGTDAIDYSVHCVNGGGTWNVDLWCNNPSNPHPFDVGHSDKGKGAFGTYDLQGNLLNILADDQGDMPASCTKDCVIRKDGATRAEARGISFLYPNHNLAPQATYNDMISGRPITVRKNFNGAAFGFRCAYPVEWTSQ